MNNGQQEQRRAAAQAFMEALEQMTQSFEATEETAPLKPQPIQPALHLDLSALEDAAADIERFFALGN
jgi:hypothetical protein